MYNQTFDPGFYISLHNKDLGIARTNHTNELTSVAPEECVPLSGCLFALLLQNEQGNVIDGIVLFAGMTMCTQSMHWPKKSTGKRKKSAFVMSR